MVIVCSNCNVCRGELIRAHQLAPASGRRRGVSAAAAAGRFQSKSTGCEATVSHRTPVLHFFCLASALRRSISVPHLSLSALLQCVVSYQLVRKPSSHGFLSCPFIVGVGPQPSLNIFNGICLCFG